MYPLSSSENKSNFSELTEGVKLFSELDKHDESVEKTVNHDRIMWLVLEHVM